VGKLLRCYDTKTLAPITTLSMLQHGERAI